MDSSFDLDSSNVPIPNDNESDIDAQLIAEQEISRYQETIDDLRKQNTILKAQFEQAVIITKQIDSVHEKNALLSNHVRSLQTENENLQHRLDISLRHIEEVECQLETEKAALAQHFLQSNSEKEIEVTKAQKHCTGKIDTLLLKIKKLEESKEQSDVKNKMLNSKIERMLQASAEYFNLSFGDIDLFTDFLHRPINASSKTNEAKQTTSTTTTTTNIQHTSSTSPTKQKQNRADKKKIKTLKKHCEKLVSEVNRLQSDISCVELKHAQEIKAYQNEIQQLKDDGLLSQTDLNHTIGSLRAKNQNQKKEIQRLRKESIPTAPLCPPSPVSPSSSAQTPFSSPININNFDNSATLREENESLAQQNQELAKKSKINEEARADMLIKLKHTEDECTKLQLVISRLESEKQAAIVVQTETLSELKSVRERLRMKEELKPKHEIKVIDKLKDEITRLESTIQSQTDQIHNLHLQAENEKHEKATNELKLRSAQSDIEEMQNKILNLNDELNIVNDKLNSKPEITVEDIMPDSAFRFKDFDSVLSQKIEKVIGNQYLAPQSKLNRIYNVIHKFYSSIVDEKNGSVQHMTEHLELVKRKVNKFLVDLSIGLSFDALTFDDFIDRDEGQKIIERSTECYKGFDELKRKNAQLNSIVEHISNEFGGVDFHSHINTIRQQIEVQTENARQTAKKYNELRRKSKNFKKSSNTKLLNAEKQKKELNNTVRDLRNEIENYTSQIQDLKKELQYAKTEISSLRDSKDQTEEDIRGENQQIVGNITKQHLSEKEKLKAQINKMKAENEKARSVLNNNETAFGRMKKLLDQHQLELQAKDEELLSYKQERENEISNINVKFQTEKKQLQKTFNNAIAEIRKQCEDQRDDVSRISQDLKQQKEKNQQLLSTAAKMKREKQKLERDVKTLEEQIKRDQMISEASIKNQILSVEESYSQQLHEAKAKIESEKRRLFSFTAEEFRKYFNPSESLDERSFKSLMNRVKKELERLSESDAVIRRLTSAVPRQATDEAVAKLVTP